MRSESDAIEDPAGRPVQSPRRFPVFPPAGISGRIHTSQHSYSQAGPSHFCSPADRLFFSFSNVRFLYPNARFPICACISIFGLSLPGYLVDLQSQLISVTANTSVLLVLFVYPVLLPSLTTSYSSFCKYTKRHPALPDVFLRKM